MRVAILCPFDLTRLTGTPIRTRVSIAAARSFSQVSVLASVCPPTELSDECVSIGVCRIAIFTRRSFCALREFSPSLIHCVTTAALPAAFLYKLTHPRTPILYEMHGWSWFELCGQRGLFIRLCFFLLDIAGLWCARSVIVMSYTQRNFVSRWMWRPSKITVLWGALADLPSYQVPTIRDTFIVGYVGNNSWWQGLSFLTEAARLLADHPSIRFRIGGVNVCDLSEVAHLPTVQVEGKIPRERVVEFLQSCDVLVSPRLPQGVSHLQYPHKLSEYLSAGRPVIVSIASDQPLIISSAHCGELINPLTGSGLADAIIRMSLMTSDERVSMGERAYTFAKDNLSLPVLVKKLQKVYECTLSTNSVFHIQ